MSVGPALLLALAPLAPFAASAQEPPPAQPPSAAAAQDPLPEGMVAVWDGGGLDEAAFERWLGRNGTYPEYRDEALRHLVQLQFIRRAAAMNGIEVADAEAEERVAAAEAALASGGESLDKVLAERMMTRDEFRDLMRSAILHERLTRISLGIAEDAPVTPEQMRAWTEAVLPEATMAALLEAADEAPPGVALESGDIRIGARELGLTLRRIVPASRLRQYLEFAALMDALPRWGRENGVLLTDDLLNEEIEWRRRFVARSPESFGVTYEMILETRGMTVEDVLQSDELRLAGWLRLYAERSYPDAWFEALSAEERAALMEGQGATRKTAWVLLRAVENPDELDLGFDEAAAELRRLAADVQTAEDFQQLAERYSDDEPTRRRQGVMGWLHVDEPRVAPAVCEAAFATPLGKVSEPVRLPIGVALVMPLEEQAAPGEERFREEVRRARHQPLQDAFLESIGLRTIYDQAP